MSEGTALLLNQAAWALESQAGVASTTSSGPGMRIDAAVEDQTMPAHLSLTMCHHCQQHLVSAFQHCLSKTYSLFPSVNAIDEVADAQLLTEPPYFELTQGAPTQIREQNAVARLSHALPPPPPLSSFPQATAAVCAAHDGQPARRHARARTISESATEPRAREATGMDDEARQCQTGKLFSGRIYKAILADKNQTIDQLAAVLHETQLLEHNEHKDVVKLQQALTRAMRYAAFAEEWHNKESMRLQQDVRFLKTQFSSVMAFLVHSEQEKQKIVGLVAEKQEIIAQRDRTIAELQAAASQSRAELQKSFQNFANMKETMERLKREADHGNSVMMHRNELLQRNLEKITVEYDNVSREIQLAKERLREIEFELRESISQFNATGDELRRERQAAKVILEELTMLREQHQHLEQYHEKVVDRSKQLEGLLEAATAKQIQTESSWERDRERFMEETSALRITESQLRAGFEATSGEVASLRMTLVGAGKREEELQRALADTQRRLSELQESTSLQISDLQDSLADARTTVSKQAASNEQLFRKAADLKLALDKETANTTMLQFEMIQLRKSSEEKRIAMEEQVEKLNAARQSLLVEKKTLSERLKAAQDVVEVRDAELVRRQEEFDAFRLQATERTVALEATLATTQQQLANVEGELQTTRKELEDANDRLEREMARYKTIDDNVRELESQKRINTATIQELRDEVSKHIQTIAGLQRRIAELDGALLRQTELAEAVKNELTVYRSEATVAIQERDETIARLEQRISELEGTVSLQTTQLAALESRSAVLVRQCDALRQQLLVETAQRESMSTTVDQLAAQLHTEELARADLERLQTALSARSADSADAFTFDERSRVSKLAAVSETLQLEHARLRQLDDLVSSIKAITQKPFGL